MNKKTEILVSLLMVSVASNVVLYLYRNEPETVRVDSRIEYVTVRDTIPVMTKRHLTGETMAVKASVRRHATNHEPDEPSIQLEPDTMASVCIMGDSATVTLPVEQRVYEDSLYTAYISGYRPRLDSINLRLPHTYTTITKTVSKPSKRWAVGPTVGAGYGVVGRQADVFFGVSVTWNILP